jgi:hypothetical protein
MQFTLLGQSAGFPIGELLEEAAVVFTDGESGCCLDSGDKLRVAGKRLDGMPGIPGIPGRLAR